MKNEKVISKNRQVSDEAYRFLLAHQGIAIAAQYRAHLGQIRPIFSKNDHTGSFS